MQNCKMEILRVFCMQFCLSVNQKNSLYPEPLTWAVAYTSDRNQQMEGFLNTCKLQRRDQEETDKNQ